MPTIRRKPKPADEKAAPPAEAVEVLPPAQPPPVVEYKTPVALDAPILCPRSPEDVIHNVMQRQLEDDLKNPPPPAAPNPALELLGKVQEAKDTGQTLAPYAAEASKVFQGLDVEERLTEAAVRHVRVRRIRRQLENDEFVDAFLSRCMKRGDLVPKEALIFKQMNISSLTQSVKELLDRLDNSEAQAFNPDDMTRIDWTLQMTEKSTHDFSKMTPTGREIVRKLTIRARRKLYQANVK